MIKICTVCGQGLGSSLIVEMNAKKILDELGLNENDVLVTHKNLNSYSATDGFDFVLCGIDLADNIDAGNGKKIVLENLMDPIELKEQLIKVLKK